jgi:hypothetical protein
MTEPGLDEVTGARAVKYLRKPTGPNAAPSPRGQGAEDEIELRQLFELGDFRPSPPIEDARRLESELAKKK